MNRLEVIGEQLTMQASLYRQSWNLGHQKTYSKPVNNEQLCPGSKNMAAMPWSCHDHSMIMAKHGHDHAMMTTMFFCMTFMIHGMSMA